MIPTTIMLVEDNPDDEFIAIRILRKAGILEISIARDGQEALDMLLSSGMPLPELLILDLRLPKIDGLKVLEILRQQERTEALPVVILSSSEDPRDRELCSQFGVCMFLGKPLEMVSLQQSLGKTLISCSSTG
jgi:CheY-like chemotaxis protein